MTFRKSIYQISLFILLFGFTTCKSGNQSTDPSKDSAKTEIKSERYLNLMEELVPAFRKGDKDKAREVVTKHEFTIKMFFQLKDFSDLKNRPDKIKIFKKKTRKLMEGVKKEALGMFLRSSIMGFKNLSSIDFIEYLNATIIAYNDNNLDKAERLAKVYGITQKNIDSLFKYKEFKDFKNNPKKKKEFKQKLNNIKNNKEFNKNKLVEFLNKAINE